MPTNTQKILCPSCHAEISLDEAITHQLEEAIKKQVTEEQQAKQVEFAKREKEISEKEKAVVESKRVLEKEVAEQTEKAKTEIERELRLKISKEKETEIQSLSEELKEKDKNLAEARKIELELRREKTKFEDEKQAFELEKQRQLDAEREKIKEDALKAFEAERLVKDRDKEQELKLLNEQLEVSRKQLDETRATELELRKEKINLEDEKRSFEIEKQRQLDAEREKIREDAQKKAEEDMHLKILEKDKQLQDAMKANMDLQRKLQQGSQQTQGEVLELELEGLLKGWFISDAIEPVPKGITGADVIQKVFSNAGQPCGSIAWESKHTKAWSEQWIAKLKEDQRAVNADIAVLVTEVLPKDIKNFAYRDGVWITDQNSIYGLAMALRIQLTQATLIKLANVGKNEKMEVLYGYLSGTEFRHKVEAIVEAFVGMKEDLEKERRSMVRTWAKREKQIEQVINNTAGMYGDVQGLIGTAMQPIAALEAGSDFSDDEDEQMEEAREEENQGTMTFDQDIRPEDIPF
jgi:hypothetical protein